MTPLAETTRHLIDSCFLSGLALSFSFWKAYSAQHFVGLIYLILKKRDILELLKRIVDPNYGNVCLI